MDGFIVMAICIICIILSFFLCVHCYKGAKRGRVLHPPVTVTNAHITATPAIQTPYPINTPHLMPQPMAQPLHPPGLGFNGIGQGYQTAPYPLVSEFEEGGLAVVPSNWLTPRKKEVFWPPIKNSKNFENILLRKDIVEEGTWKLHPIRKIFSECVQSLEDSTCSLPQTPNNIVLQSQNHSILGLPSHSNLTTPRESKFLQIDANGYQTLLQKLNVIQEQNKQILSLVEETATKQNSLEVPEFPAPIPLHLKRIY